MNQIITDARKTVECKHNMDGMTSIVTAADHLFANSLYEKRWNRHMLLRRRFKNDDDFPGTLTVLYIL